MTAGRPRPGKGGDQGISVILGAMMLTGILLSSYVVYQVSVVPSMEDAKHVGHMREVGGQLSQVVAGLETQLDNRSGSADLHPITLGRDGTGLLVTAPVPGTLSHQSGDLDARLTIDTLRLQRVNGSEVGGATESWATVTDETLTDVLRVTSFRLKIAEISSDHADENVTVAVTDRHGKAAGDLRVNVTDSNGKGQSGANGAYEVWLRVRDGDQQTLYDQPIHSSSGPESAQNGPISPFWIDLLRPEYRFDRVLGNADTPMDIALLPGGLDAEYAVTYEKTGDSGGSVVVGGGGKEVSDLHRSYQGGQLAYRSSGQALGGQELVLEHGALILAQEDGAVLKASPPFQASLVGERLALSIGLPMLGGGGGAITGSGTGSLLVQPQAASHLHGEANQLSLNLTTGFPAVWQRIWQDGLDDAGLEEGTGYTVTTGASWANLTVYGYEDPAPGSSTYDISLDVRQATLGVGLDG